MRRMDRYKTEDSTPRRLEKNQELYQNIASNTIYTNITDVTNTNAFEIDNNTNNNSYTTREAYHQMHRYENIEPVPRVKKELDDFNYIYKQNPNKVYDINSVLEMARKNHQGKDALDEKRKLKNISYNILAGLNQEELEKYREEKRKRMTTPDEEEIRELIDTIASKTLAGEIDKETGIDLLSDLMATNVMDKVDGIETISEKTEITETIIDNPSVEDVLEKKQQEEQVEKKNNSTNELKGKDNDFYTKSMELSDKDFDLSDEFKEKQLPLPIKILLILLIIAVILVGGYFIYQRIK